MALQIKKNALGEDHIELEYELINLGLVYYGQKKLELAEKQYQKAMQIQKKNLGEDHP